MNFGGFVLPYLEKLKRRSAGMPDMGDVDYGSSIGRGGVGPGFDTNNYSGYMGREDDEIAGGNYGKVLPYAGVMSDVRRGNFGPNGGVAAWLRSGGGQGRSAPSSMADTRELMDYFRKRGSRIF